ncbi:MAG TPA: SDR family NAD(P)-dependent oxidoreductase [Gammaproteobacteria bacterium]|jgi:NAD(P)-dependent dehydrogenase (short-subunit alcohol dehydrogenase family)|nr:SDR family NAD(P)-dependent oxidoreductase [Gammaproteobacteria bacterium]
MTELLLAGRRALVTGGASGIGQAAARRLARAGAEVMIADIDTERALETVRAIKADGGAAHFRESDVSNRDDVRHMVRDASEIMGGLSILFNNAMANPLDSYSEDERWNVMLESGLTAYWAAAIAAAPHLAESGHGAIVQTASIAGARIGIDFASEAYCAAKAGIVGLTRKLAKRLGPDNIRVNCIAPGVIKTPRLAYSGSDIPEFARRSQKMTPLQRLGTAEEVAELVLFLACDRSSYITAQDIAIDGGLALAPLFETVDLP